MGKSPTHCLSCRAQRSPGEGTRMSALWENSPILLWLVLWAGPHNEVGLVDMNDELYEKEKGTVANGAVTLGRWDPVWTKAMRMRLYTLLYNSSLSLAQWTQKGYSNTALDSFSQEFSYANDGLVTVCDADLPILRLFPLFFFVVVHDSFSWESSRRQAVCGFALLLNTVIQIPNSSVCLSLNTPEGNHSQHELNSHLSHSNHLNTHLPS